MHPLIVILVAWVVASGAIAWVFSRWMRFLRGDFDVMNDAEERFGNR